MHSDFMSWIRGFREVSYDLVDTGARQFDEDFYQFRGQVRDLERRIAYALCRTIRTDAWD